MNPHAMRWLLGLTVWFAVSGARAGARGHEALNERTARQLPQAEKAVRATYAVDNSGSLRELEQELSGVLAKLKS